MLPREYSRIPDDILGELLRRLQSLPETIEGDGFGLIYEYFLGKFALAEGRGGGEFFTPKTAAGMLNDHGGTLLIGVTDDGEPVGLEADYALVKPPNADGLVNWLDTLFDNSLGHVGANLLAIRMDQVNGHDICRIDIPASSRPIWVKNPNGDDTLYQRRDNSTRQVPTNEIKPFLTDRFGKT